MRAYWVLTLIVSGLVMARTNWPSALNPTMAAALVVTAATVLTPIALLLYLRGGFRAFVRGPR